LDEVQHGVGRERSWLGSVVKCTIVFQKERVLVGKLKKKKEKRQI
jgi:hypothetical protein